MPDAAQLIARIGGDASQYRDELRQSGQQTNAFAGEMRESLAHVSGLTERINLQERGLQLLKQRHADSVASTGLFSDASQRLQLQIDKQTTSINTSQTSLANEKQHLADLAKEAEKAGDAAGAFGDIMTGALRRIGEIGVDAVVSGLRAAGDAAKDFVQTGIESYGTNERITQSYQSLIAAELQRKDSTLSQADALQQASGRAQELVQWNQQLAINSPFSEESAAKATQVGMAYGFTSDEAQRLTQVLTDTSAALGGSGDGMERIERALGQIESRGKTTAQEFNQLSEAGINARQILADAFGVSTAQIEKMNETGQLTADKVIPAIVDSLDKSFHGAAQRQADTVQGLGNSLQDLYAIAARDIIGPAVEAGTPAVKELVQTLQDPQTRAEMQELGKSIGDFARDEIPVLVEQGKELVTTLHDAYTTAEPFITFLGQNATPIISGLGAAYAVSLVPGIVSATKSIVEQGPAALKLYGPGGAWALAAVAIGAAVEEYQRFNDQVDRKSGEVVDKIGGKEANKDLAEFGRLTDEQQAKLKPFADAIVAQQQRLKAFVADSAKSEADAFFEGDREEIRKRRDEGLKSGEISLRALNAELQKRIEGEAQAQAAAHSYDAIEAQRLERDTRYVDVQKEQLKNLNDLTDAEKKKIEASAGKVDDRQERIAQLQEKNLAASAEREVEHNKKLSAIETHSNQERLAAETAFNTGRGEAITAYNSKIQELEQAAAQKRTELDYTEGQRRLESERQLGEALVGITQKRNEQQVAYDHDREIAAQEHDQRLGEMDYAEGQRAADSLAQRNVKISDLEAQRTEIQSQASADRLKAEQDYQASLDSFQSKQNTDEEAFLRSQSQLQQHAADEMFDRRRGLHQKLDDLQRTNQQTLATIQETQSNKDIDIEETRAQKIADIRTSLANKLSGLQTNASYKTEDDAREFGYDKEDRATEHNDKLKELQASLAAEMNGFRQQDIQKQIDAENQRYAAAEARAERDFQRKEEQAARELARQQEQARREAQQAEAAAAVEASRQTAQAQQTADRAREAAQQQYQIAEEAARRAFVQANLQAAIDLQRNQRDLQAKRDLQIAGYAQQRADLDAHYAAELAAQDVKLAADLSKIDQQMQKERDAYTTREADAAEHYQHELSTLQTNYSQQLAALDYKNNQETIKLNQAVQAAQSAYAERERKAKESYDHETQQQAAALAQQEADARTSYDTKLADLRKHLEDTNKTIAAKRVEQSQAEDAAYREQEAKAQASYSTQRQQLLKALGEQLQDFNTQQQEMTLISVNEASKRTAIIAAETGADPTTARSDYINTINRSFGSSGGGYTLNGQGGISIGSVTVNGTDDPAKQWQAIKEEAIREAQRNGYAVIGGMS